MRDTGWYGRKYDLDPLALQLRVHVELPRRRRATHARLFQVPSAERRDDSPLWQYVDGWAFDPEAVGPIRSVDDALERVHLALLQQRLPGIG